jgi:predicted lactoylglutathione lyase
MYSMTVIRISTVMLLATASFSWTATGFSPLSISNNNQPSSLSSSSSSSSRLYAQGLKKSTGFGGGGESKKKSGFGGMNKNEIKDNDGKLKPMQQWNRYKDLKGEPKIRVGVRIIGDDDNKDWFEVGRIKSKESKYTEMAVFRQRAIIAEVSS